jgi:DNA-binding protein Fis
VSLDAIERAHIESVMQATGGNMARAASVLGIDRTTLYRKLKHYEPER